MNTFKRMVSALKGKQAPTETLEKGHRVQVTGNIPGIDMIPGDVYSVTDVDKDGNVKVNHNLGTKHDRFLPKEFFKKV